MVKTKLYNINSEPSPHSLVITDGSLVTMDELQSAIQKYVRRGITDKATLCAHALYYGTRNQKNCSFYTTTKRLLLNAFEDISIGDPCIYEYIYFKLKNEKDGSKKRDFTDLVTVIDITYKLSRIEYKYRIPPLNIVGMYGQCDSDIINELSSRYNYKFELQKPGHFNIKSKEYYFNEIKSGLRDRNLVRICFAVSILRMGESSESPDYITSIKDSIKDVFDLLISMCQSNHIRLFKEIYYFILNKKGDKNPQVNILYTAILLCYYERELFNIYKNNPDCNMNKIDPISISITKKLEELYKDPKTYNIRMDDYVYDKHTRLGKKTRGIKHFFDEAAIVIKDITMVQGFGELDFIRKIGEKCYLKIEKAFGTKNAKSDFVKRFIMTGVKQEKKKRNAPKKKRKEVPTEKTEKTEKSEKKKKTIIDREDLGEYGKNVQKKWLTHLSVGNKPNVYIVKVGNNFKIIKGPYSTKKVPENQYIMDKIKYVLDIPSMNSEIIYDGNNKKYYILINTIFGLKNEDSIKPYTGNDGKTYYKVLSDLRSYLSKSSQLENVEKMLEIVLMYYVFQVSDTGLQNILIDNGKYYPIDEQGLFSRNKNNIMSIVDIRTSEKNKDLIMRLMKQNKKILLDKLNGWVKKIKSLDKSFYSKTSISKDFVDENVMNNVKRVETLL